MTNSLLLRKNYNLVVKANGSMNYEILDDIKPKEFVELRKSVEWKEINLEQSTIALNNTMIKVSIVVDKKVVAMGRLVGDYSCKGVLSYNC